MLPHEAQITDRRSRPAVMFDDQQPGNDLRRREVDDDPLEALQRAEARRTWRRPLLNASNVPMFWWVLLALGVVIMVADCSAVRP